MTIKQQAFGRWRHILAALNVPSGLLTRKPQPCPMCGGKDRFVFDDKYRNGDYFCRQCGAGTGFTLLHKLHGWDYRQIAQEVERVIGELPRTGYAVKPRKTMSWQEVAQIWHEAKSITIDDPVDTYLRRRGISMPSWPKDLRFVERLKHSPTQKTIPSMMALFRDQGGNLGTIHRTYLAQVTPHKMFLPTPVPVGGAIRLFGPEREMGIAEGIETALSAAMIFRMPVWATTSERLLRAWLPPQGVRTINVFGDHDKNHVGQSAAHDLAKRLILRHGYRVEVRIPDVKGWDWNDVLKNEIATERYPDLSQLRVHDRDQQPAS